MLGMREAVVFLVIITKGEIEGSMRRMRVFAWRVDVSGEGRHCLGVDDKTACSLYSASTGQETGRVRQDSRVLL